MKLVRMVMQGFKSFKDKTVITFDEGITGIVGPNGCGKSNIVDALFWVMGEQSAKHLRGTKMKDVIFSGSSKYGPASWAEVTLVLGNEEQKHIHIGQKVVAPAEILLTRKLYRNGESEYRMNDVPCRLKDIQEVFMDTGAGAKSYSIIAQGEINRLVQAKPVERRSMIEEVAGITKFKVRRKESTRKIEATQANLVRLHDLITEIEKQKKSFQSQAEKAQKARALRDKIRDSQLLVDSHRELDYLETFVSGNAKETQNQTLLEEIQVSATQAQLQREQLEHEKLTRQEELDRLQAEFNQHSKDMASAQATLEAQKSAQTARGNRQEKVLQQLQELDAYIEERSGQLEQVSKDLAKALSGEDDETQLSDLEEATEIHKERYELAQEQYRDLKLELNQATNERQSLELKLQQTRSSVEQLDRRHGELSEELELLEDEGAREGAGNDKLRTQVEELRKQHATLKEQTDRSSAELKEMRIESSKAKERNQQLQKELVRDESKLESLRSLSSESDAGMDIDALKEASIDFTELSESILCLPQYESLIESVLGSALGMVGMDQSEVLASDLPALQGVLCVESASDSADLPDGIKALSETLEVIDGPSKRFIEAIIEGVYFSNTLPQDIVDVFQSNPGIRVLASEDGLKVATRHGSWVEFVSKDPNWSPESGKISRANTMHTLSESIESLQAQLGDSESEVQKFAQDISELEEIVEERSSRTSKVHSELIAVESTLRSKEELTNKSQSRENLLRERLKDSREERLEKLEQIEQVEESLGQLDVSELEDRFSDIETELETHKEHFEEAREELLAAQAAIKGREAMIRGLEQQKSQLTQQQEREEKQTQDLNDELEQLTADSASYETLRSSLEERCQELATVLGAMEKDVNASKSRVQEILDQMQNLDKELRKSHDLKTKLEKELVEIDVRRQQIQKDEGLLVRNIFELYQVDLRETLRAFLGTDKSKLEGLEDIGQMFFMEGEEGLKEIEIQAYDFDKKFPSVVKEHAERLRKNQTELRKLGEINWNAVEEFNRQKLRYDFLKIQEEQLLKSIADLEAAIEHIDTKGRQRFQEAFDEVNMRFQRVFPIIFGGGEARLQLVGHIDDPDCGVDIVAMPPGKKMQNINLMSGGEKAMTAVSLIFSIFLVKPSPFCLLDEVDAPLDDANVGRFNELLREMSSDLSSF